MKFPGVICAMVACISAYQGFTTGLWLPWAWAIIYLAVSIDMLTHGS